MTKFNKHCCWERTPYRTPGKFEQLIGRSHMTGEDRHDRSTRLKLQNCEVYESLNWHGMAKWNFVGAHKVARHPNMVLNSTSIKAFE